MTTKSFKCGRVLFMPLSSVELQSIASLSRRRHGFDSRTVRQYSKDASESPFEKLTDFLLDNA